jgi:hypothetical protein
LEQSSASALDSSRGDSSQIRVASRHFREHWGNVYRTEEERSCDAQSAAKIASCCLFCQIDLGADPDCVDPKRDPGFWQTSATRRAGHQLDAKLFFQSSEAPADNRFGNAKPVRSWRYPLPVGNLNKRTQVVISATIVRF